MRTRRFAAALGLALVLALSAPVHAVGTVVVTTTYVGFNVTQYQLAWTSNASGAVSANPLAIRGHLLGVKFVPGAGGTQPTDLYDATLVDVESLDILNAQAANLSNVTGRYFLFDPRFFVPGGPGGQTLDLVIANAGNAKTGTVYIWVQA